MSKTLIGTDLDQVPTNADLGDLAYQDADFPTFKNLKLTGSMIIGDVSTASGSLNLSRSLTVPSGSSGDLFLFGPSPEIGFLDANLNRSSAIDGNDGAIKFSSYSGATSNAIDAVVDGSVKATYPSNVMAEMTRVNLDGSGNYSSGGDLDIKLGSLKLGGSTIITNSGQATFYVNDNTEYSSTEASELNTVGTDALTLYNSENSSTYGKVSILMRSTGGGGAASSRITLKNERSGNGTLAFFFRGAQNTSQQNEVFRMQDDGKMGINTSSPSARLHIGRDANMPSTKDTTALVLESYLATVSQGDYHNYQELLFDGGTSYNFSSIRQISNGWATGNSGLTFHTSQHGGSSNAERMRILGNGKIGMGTTDPTASLHIKESDGVGAIIKMEDVSGGTQTATIHYDQTGQNSLVISTQYQSSSNENRIALRPGDHGVNRGIEVVGGTSDIRAYIPEAWLGYSENTQDVFLSPSTTPSAPLTFYRANRSYGNHYSHVYEVSFPYVHGSPSYQLKQFYLHFVTNASKNSKYNIQMTLGRSGSERTFGGCEFDGYTYSEGDGDFRNWGFGDILNMSGSGQYAQINDVPTGYLINEAANLNASSETGRNSNNQWDYMVIRVPIQISNQGQGQQEIYMKIEELTPNGVQLWAVGITT